MSKIDKTIKEIEIKEQSGSKSISWLELLEMVEGQMDLLEEQKKSVNLPVSDTELLEALDKYTESRSSSVLLERGPAPKPIADPRKAAEALMASLPKFVPNELWGQSGSAARKEIKTFIKQLGGRTLQDRLRFLMRLQEENTNITSTSRIISTLILLESLRAIIISYGSSPAGFVFEGFIAALMNGDQVTEGDEKTTGPLPIEDVMAFTYDGQRTGIPYSLKLLKKGGEVKGSFRNLMISLFGGDGMGYVVANKIGDPKGKDFKISIREFYFTSDNIIEILSMNSPNMKLLTLPNGKVITQEMINKLNKEKALQLLLQSKGAADESGKTQWIISETTLRAIDHELIGEFSLSESQIVDTASKYMNEMEGNITELFSLVGALSAHINNYIINKKRDDAIQNGKMAIQDTSSLKRTLSKEKDLK